SPYRARDTSGTGRGIARSAHTANTDPSSAFHGRKSSSDASRPLRVWCSKGFPPLQHILRIERLFHRAHAGEIACLSSPRISLARLSKTGDPAQTPTKKLSELFRRNIGLPVFGPIGRQDMTDTHPSNHSGPHPSGHRELAYCFNNVRHEIQRHRHIHA